MLYAMKWCQKLERFNASSGVSIAVRCFAVFTRAPPTHDKSGHQQPKQHQRQGGDKGDPRQDEQ